MQTTVSQLIPALHTLILKFVVVNREMGTFQSFSFHPWLLLLLLLGLALHLAPLCAATGAQYGIMMDAGSSATRLEIYRSSDADGVLQVSEVQQIKAEPHKMKPGLASFADHIEDIKAYLQPLLDAAQEAIPAEQHAATPIILMGTAGMRLLGEQQAKRVLDEVVRLFSDKALCPFKFEPNNAQIISGQWEGIYAWITTNFLKGTFSSTAETPRPYGILDQGGASQQNAFVTDQNKAEHKTLTLGGKDYEVFSRSYLGYGLDQARDRFHEVLFEDAWYCSKGEECVVLNPCQLWGYNEVRNIDGVLVNFTGLPNMGDCRNTIKQAFFCKTKDCPFHDQPLLKGPFVGISGFYYTLKDIGMLHETNKVTLSGIAKYSRAFCKQNYVDLEDNPFAHKLCFDSNYLLMQLKQGYRLRLTNNEITALSSLNGFNVGWTLGALLYNTKML